MSMQLHEFPIIPMAPGSDMAGTQYQFCKLGTDGNVYPITDSTSFAFGVVKNQPSAGTGGNVQFLPAVVLGGVTDVQVDAAYNSAVALCSDSSGRGTAADSSHAMYVRAITIESSGAANDIVACLLVNSEYEIIQGLQGATGIQGNTGIAGRTGIQGTTGL